CPLHLIDTTISFTAGFLDDDSPVQCADSAIGAQHGDVLFAFSKVELVRGCHELCFTVLLEHPNNFKIGHVLTGGVVAGGCGHQASPAIDHVRCEAATTYLLQAPD